MIRITPFFKRNTLFWLQPGCFLVFHETKSLVFLNFFLNLKTSNDNNKENGCSGFMRHVMGVDLFSF